MTPAGLARAVGTAAVDLARLIVPVECAGCGAWDVRLCQDCGAPWWEPPERVESTAPRLDVEDRAALPVWALRPLTGSSGEVVRAWKDRDRRDLDAWLCAAMRRACADVVARAVATGGPVQVIAAPARRAGTRRRGVDLPLLLTRAAAAGLRDAGLSATAVAALRIGSGESRGRSARGRWRDARAVHTVRPVRGTAVLVDDVLTTGATLASCARALEAQGAAVAAAVVVASSDTGRAPARVGLG